MLSQERHERASGVALAFAVRGDEHGVGVDLGELLENGAGDRVGKNGSLFVPPRLCRIAFFFLVSSCLDASLYRMSGTKRSGGRVTSEDSSVR